MNFRARQLLGKNTHTKKNILKLFLTCAWDQTDGKSSYSWVVNCRGKSLVMVRAKYGLGKLKCDTFLIISMDPIIIAFKLQLKIQVKTNLSYFRIYITIKEIYV